MPGEHQSLFRGKALHAVGRDRKTVILFSGSSRELTKSGRKHPLGIGIQLEVARKIVSRDYRSGAQQGLRRRIPYLAAVGIEQRAIGADDTSRSRGGP